MGKFNFVEFRKKAEKCPTLIGGKKGTELKTAIVNLETAIRQNNYAGYETAVKVIQAKTKVSSNRDVIELRSQLTVLEQHIKRCKALGNPFSNIDLGADVQAAGTEGATGGAKEFSDKDTGMKVSSKPITRSKKEGSKDSLLKQQGNKRPRSRTSTRSSGQDEETSKQDEQSLLKIRLKLIKACTMETDEKTTPPDESQRVAVYIKDIETYTDTLIEKLNIQSDLKGVKETKMQMQLNNMESKVLDGINGWLQKLETQIENNMFDERDFKDTGKSKLDDKKTRKSIEDICIKLKNRQSEFEEAENRKKEAVVQLEKEILTTEKGQKGKNAKDKCIMTIIHDCHAAVKAEKEALVQLEKEVITTRKGQKGSNAKDRGFLAILQDCHAAVKAERKKGEDKQREDETEMQEFIKLMKESLAAFHKTIRGEPFMFEKPQQSKKRNIDDFREQFRQPLLLMFEIEDTLRGNTERFSVTFVEISKVVHHLKEMHLFICEEELAVPNVRKAGSKKTHGSTVETECEEITIGKIIEVMKDRFVQKGVTRATVCDLHKTVESLNDKWKHMEQENTELRGKTQILEDKVKSLTDDLSARQRDVEKLYDDLEKMDLEKQNLLFRLSKLAGARLMDNNPNIADLSDPNRPTNIGNDYSELYDNQWTNAYEALEKSHKESKERLKFLREILEMVFGKCVRYAGRQNEIIRTLLVQPTADIQFTVNGDSRSGKGEKHTVELSAVLSTGVTDLRKQSAGECCKDITQYLKTEHKEWFKEKHVMEYTVRCVEICWLMQMQSPPLHIETDVKSEMKFDKNRYKEYTKIGKKVDFVVWPALFLHREGPLVTKGVAQGK